MFIGKLVDDNNEVRAELVNMGDEDSPSTP